MATTKNALRVIGYTRVSTDEQARSGLGLDAQRATIEAEATRRGWHLVGIETDAGVSGAKASTDRPALAAALDRLDDGDVDVLVVAKLDRLSRSVADFGSILDRADRAGWAVVVADVGVDTTSPTGRLVAGVIANVSEWEREMIRTRTREALAVKRANGVQLGRPDAPVEVVGDLADRIRSMRSDGMSLRAIADTLNDEGVETPRGGRWHAATVGRVADDGYRERERSTAADRASKRHDRRARVRAAL